MSPPRRKLPIGIQTFAEIVSEGHYCVDKTQFAHQLIDSGKYFFLSRPRRLNREVVRSFHSSLLGGLTANPDAVAQNKKSLRSVLVRCDTAGMEALFHSLFAGIPYHWHVSNGIAQYEGYYASVFYAYFAALGLDIRLVEATNRGRLDMAVRHAGQIWLFEFKVVERTPAGGALQQIKDMGYAEKYRREGLPIHLVGVEFSTAARNVVKFEAALA